MKRFLYIIGIFLVSVLLVVAMLLAVLASDEVETAAVRLVTKELSRALGTNARVGAVEYRFPARISLRDIYLEDRQQDTLAYIQEVYAHFSPLALREGEIRFSQISISGGVGKVYQVNESEGWNYQFLIDALKSEQTSSSAPLGSIITVRDVQLSDIRLQYNDYLLSLHQAALQLHHFSQDTIDAQISRWSMDIHLKENGGYSSEYCAIEDLQVHAILSDSTLSMPILKAHLPRSSFDASGGKYNLQSGQYAIQLHHLSVVPSDISLFAPVCKSLHQPIELTGTISGSRDSVRLDNLLLQYALRKIATGNIEVCSFGADPYLYANLKDLHTHPARLQDFLSRLRGEPIHLPKELLRVGEIHYRGIAEGHIHNLRLNGAFRTSVGTISTNATMVSDSTFSHIDYSAHVEAQKIRLGVLLDRPLLGPTTLSLHTEGQIDKGVVKGELNACVHELRYNGYTYQDLTINGSYEPQHYDGHFRIEDPCIDLAFDGKVNMQTHSPEINFDLHCRHFDSSPLLSKAQRDARLRTHFHMSAEMRGTNADHITGYLVVDSLFLATTADSLLMTQMRLFASAEEDNNKSITLQSDYLNGAIDGSFRYCDIVPACQALLHHYLPAAVEAPQQEWFPVSLTLSAEGARLSEVQRLLVTPLTISDQPRIEGRLTARDGAEPEMDILVFADSVEAGNLPIHNLTVALHTIDTLRHSQTGSGLALSVSAETMQMKTIFSSLAFNDTLLSQLTLTQDEYIEEQLPEGWREMSPRELQRALSNDLTFQEQRQLWLTAQRSGVYGGDIQTVTHFSRYNQQPLINVHFRPGTLILRDSVYTLSESNITYCAADTSLTVNRFLFKGAGQSIEANGVASPYQHDTLHVDLQKIDAAYVVPFILPKQTIMFNGLLTGPAQIAGAFRQPSIEADIHVDSMGLNNCYFGDATVDLHIYPERQQTDTLLPPQLQFHANVECPNRHVVLLDGEAIFDGSGRWKLDMETDSVPLAFINHWTSSVLHDLDGHATGKVVVGGSKGKVYVLVNAAAQNASFTLPWTGARYTIEHDTIVLDTTAILFPNVHAKDELGNPVIVNGGIYHHQFRDFVLDLHADAHNALVFDLDKKGEMLQGKVYANGHVDITGPDNDILVAADATTTGKSQFRLSVDNVSSASQSNFVHFVQHSDSIEVTAEKAEKEEPITASRGQRCLLTLNIEVNPQLLFQLVLGERNGDIIQAHGNGALRLTYDTQTGEVRLLGTYDIEQGTLSYTVANVIRKEFSIGEGSTIVFSGNPTNPQLEVTAKYRVTASLKDLFGDEVNQLATTRTSIPVLTCLHMRNTLNNPILNFSLEFPSSDQAVQQQVRQAINTDEMLMRQVIYLLVFGRFFTPEHMAQAQHMTLNSTYSLLSSTVTGQINAWLSKLTDALTLGVAIRTDGEGANSSQEYEAQFQLQPIDRLVINGNVGYRYNDISNQPFFGDLDVEVMLTEDGQFRLKGYTHTVDKYSLREASTIQGVGFVWKKDFNWPKNKKKAEKSKVESGELKVKSQELKVESQK